MFFCVSVRESGRLRNKLICYLIEITNFYLDKHLHEKCSNKSKRFYSNCIFLPWKNFKDFLEIRDILKHLIEADCLSYFCFFSKFPTGINNLSGAIILIFKRYFKSSCPLAFYKIGF